MPIHTDLSVTPYNNTVPPSSDYYRVLTQPAVPLQSRELIEMQEIFARQIERFGDNVLKPGSIVSGCNFLFLNPYPYVKLLDQDVFGSPISPVAYANLAILNPVTGLKAQVIDTADGYVSSDPNLKTLYLTYYNTGFNSNTTTFASGDVLTVYDSIRNGIESVSIVNGGQGFSNQTNFFAVSAIAVTPTTGTIANGQYIGNGLGANLQVIGVDSTTLANTGQVILSIAPRAVDLANASVNSTAWTVSNGQSISTSGNTATALVSGVIGTGYQGLAVTDALGAITNVLTLNKGFGYTTVPYVTMQSANNVSGYTSLSLNPQNFVAKVVVASTTNAVGSGYAFGVNEGIVYYGGSFLRVDSQTVVVSKYDTKPDNVSVVFSAIEKIITPDIDPTLNDPAAGLNQAPGANRLQIKPVLSVVNTDIADSNSQVTALVEWNTGNPYIQNQPSQYSSVGKAIATAVNDVAGDFYIDPFLVTTSSVTSNDDVAAPYVYYDVVVDAGSAYISGNKVQTTASYVTQQPFAYLTGVQNNFVQTLNFGNYLPISNVGGVFPYNTGAQVSFYSLPKGYASNTAMVKASNTTPQGTLLGTARMRGMQLASGVAGTPSAVYNLYLFNVKMNSGANFADAMSVYYSAATPGIADIVLGQSSAGTPTAQLNQSLPSTLIYPTSYASIKNVNGASYSYSSVDQTTQIANTGIYTKSLASLNQTFQWAGTALSAGNMQQLVLVPTAADIVSSVNASGSWVVNTATANLVANTGTSALTDLAAGDWLYLNGNTAQVDVKQVKQVVNSTFVLLDSAPAFANGNATITRAYPKNLPIPLGTRAGTSANVSSNGTVLSINIGFPVVGSVAANATLSVPIIVTAASPTVQTVNRSGYVMLSVANNAGGTAGPWCLGVPDVFRLRGVYVGNSTVNTSTTNYTSLFSVDNGHNPDFRDLSWLYLDTGAASPITANSYILVQLDWFSPAGSGGYFATPSYTQTANIQQILITDGQPLANLTTMASTWEIPEFFTDGGTEIDLTNTIDFRPSAVATVTPSATIGAAPINPSNVTSFSTSEKFFPVPGSNFTAGVEYYVPRIDTAYVTSNGNIAVQTGQPLFGSGSSKSNPPGTMKIADMLVPAYPNLPASRSVDLIGVINTAVYNNRYTGTRTNRHSIKLLNTNIQDAAKVYTQADIAGLDQRITNLEYTVSLNSLETATQSTVIPSSSDPSVNRYQYGFFADDFTTTNLFDLSNPDYTCTQENGDVVPSKLTWEVYQGDEFAGAQPYINQSIISQLNATIGTSGDPTTQPTCSIALANTVAYQTVYRTAYDYNSLAPSDGTIDLVSFTLADADHMSGQTAPFGTYSHLDSADPNNLGSGVVTLWFYAYANPVSFQILQGNTVVADSSQAQPLSANDVSNLTTGTRLNQWFNDQTSLYLKNPVVVNGAFVEYAGKITWNYSGAGGQTMSIRTTNGTGVQDWRWVVSFPINGDTAGCTPPPPNYTCPDGYKFDFSVMGCVINPPPQPPPTPVDWTGCGNALGGFYQYLQGVIASGASMGTVITINIGTRYGDELISGTIGDWLNPISSQSIELLEQDAQLSGWNGHVADAVGYYGTAASGLQGGKYVQNGQYVTYYAPWGGSATIDLTTGTVVSDNLNANYQASQLSGRIASAIRGF